jgi:hypothetical protein
MTIRPHVVREGGYSVLQPRRHLVVAAALLKFTAASGI